MNSESPRLSLDQQHRFNEHKLIVHGELQRLLIQFLSEQDPFKQIVLLESIIKQGKLSADQILMILQEEVTFDVEENKPPQAVRVTDLLAVIENNVQGSLGYRNKTVATFQRIFKRSTFLLWEKNPKYLKPSFIEALKEHQTYESLKKGKVHEFTVIGELGPRIYLILRNAVNTILQRSAQSSQTDSPDN